MKYTKKASVNYAKFGSKYLDEDTSPFSEEEQDLLRNIKNNLQGFDDGKRISSQKEKFAKAKESTLKFYEKAKDKELAKKVTEELFDAIFQKDTYYRKKQETSSSFKSEVTALTKVDDVIPTPVISYDPIHYKTPSKEPFVRKAPFAQTENLSPKKSITESVLRKIRGDKPVNKTPLLERRAPVVLYDEKEKTGFDLLKKDTKNVFRKVIKNPLRKVAAVASLALASAYLVQPLFKQNSESEFETKENTRYESNTHSEKEERNTDFISLEKLFIEEPIETAQIDEVQQSSLVLAKKTLEESVTEYDTKDAFQKRILETILKQKRAVQKEDLNETYYVMNKEIAKNENLTLIMNEKGEYLVNSKGRLLFYDENVAFGFRESPLNPNDFRSHNNPLRTESLTSGKNEPQPYPIFEHDLDERVLIETRSFAQRNGLDFKRNDNGQIYVTHVGEILLVRKNEKTSTLDNKPNLENSTESEDENTFENDFTFNSFFSNGTEKLDIVSKIRNDIYAQIQANREHNASHVFDSTLYSTQRFGFEKERPIGTLLSNLNQLYIKETTLGSGKGVNQEAFERQRILVDILLAELQLNKDIPSDLERRLFPRGDIDKQALALAMSLIPEPEEVIAQVIDAYREPRMVASRYK